MADEETGNKSPETETAAVEPNVPIWVKWGGKGLVNGDEIAYFLVL